MRDESSLRFVPAALTAHRKLHFLFFLRIPAAPGMPPRWLLSRLEDWRCAACASRFRLSFETTVTMACSKISSTPFISLLLHSMYWAFIFCATPMPCSRVTGVRPWVLSMSMQVFL